MITKGAISETSQQFYFFLAIRSGTFRMLLVEDLVLSKNEPAINQWVKNICL